MCLSHCVDRFEGGINDWDWHDVSRHSIHIIRQTFDQLASTAELDPNTRILYISSPTSSPSARVEISTIYFCAGYTPTDYPTAAHYATRFLLEKSRVIKCPTIPLQLAGGKKVQQVLCGEGVAEGFLRPGSGEGGEAGGGAHSVTEEDVKLLRESWMTMWGLSDADGVSRAREKHETLVLKPQREGGGNNIYKASIPSFLDTLPEEEREAWIAMELISFPRGVKNYLVETRASFFGLIYSPITYVHPSLPTHTSCARCASTSIRTPGPNVSLAGALSSR